MAEGYGPLTFRQWSIAALDELTPALSLFLA
jgi:hypothetical protein